MTIPVPHFQQLTPYSCLPACARMVIAFLGHDHSEEELTRTFNTVPLLGTLPENMISGLEAMGYRVLWFENATIDRLRALLEHKWPIITLVQATDLPHGTAGLHAVVVIGMSEGEIAFLDPVLKDVMFMSLPNFERAWSNLGHQGIVIWHQTE
ncbi:MAG: C39 family peptidase [Caldilineaceae bacterium]